jgi:hypothetical protein
MIYEFDNTKIGNNGSESKIKLTIRNGSKITFKDFLEEENYNKLFYLYGKYNRQNADKKVQTEINKILKKEKIL